MIKKSAIVVALIACVVMALATATPAAASATSTPASMQQRVNAVLAAEPGGIQTAWNEVSWDDGAIVLTLADETVPAAEASQVGTCASGTFCVYSVGGG